MTAEAKYVRNEVFDWPTGSIVDHYVVTNVANGFEAIGAVVALDPSHNGLGKPYNGHNEYTVQRYAPEVIGDIEKLGGDTTWHYSVRVIYETFHGTLVEPPAVAVYHWSIGTMSQHIACDLDGMVIGAKYIQTATGGVFKIDKEGRQSATGRPLQNPEGLVGAEVFVPTIELEIEMPLGTNWVPDYVATLVGRCNSDTMYFRGCPPVNPGYVLFTGAACEYSPTEKPKINYRFTLAAAERPTGVPIRFGNGADYTGPDIPICYGLETQPYAVADANGFPVIQDRPRVCYIFKAYALKPLSPLLANISPGRIGNDI